MSTSERDALEGSIRAQCDAGAYDDGATLAIKGYGAEIYGFLVTLHRSEEEASDVFATVCENLWRGLPRFGWGSSLRTWVYTITRHASLRHRKNAQRRARGGVPMSQVASMLAAEVRTATQQCMKTEQKDAFTRIRESLPPEDQMLLVLRVDRGLAWNDLARILLGNGDGAEGAPEMSGENADEETLKREAARLRKRFQLVKEKLVELGRREGLIEPKG
jgi:RNA polymerase sigma-70 factor (ECF subfamily)